MVDRSKRLKRERPVRLIHITDLHFTMGNAFQQALIAGLLKDFQKLYESGYVPDFLVFSGDLVNNPDEPDIYARFEAQFLHPAIQALRLRPEEVIFCPGNHDISHETLKQWKDERDKLAKAMAADQGNLDGHLALQPTKAYVTALSERFFDLAKRCGNSWSNPFVHTYGYPAKKIAFVAINSGYGCGLEGSQFDRGKLSISANSVLQAFQEIPDGHQAISLMHHTLADLTESTTRVLNPLLAKNSAMHLFGHVHQPFPTVVSTTNSSCFMIQGGALYERAGLYNGYCYVSASPDYSHMMAKYQTYYVDRQEFDVGTNVALEGTVYNSSGGRSHWDNLIPAPPNDDVCLWLMETSDALVKQLDTTITGKSLSSTFVEPTITKQTQEDDPTSSAYRFTISDILKSRDHTVLCCPTEHGATSLLSFLTMKFHSDCLNLPKAVVPIFIDARRIRGTYEAMITASLRSALPESDQRQFKLGPLHENGRIVVLVDDVDPSNNQHIAYLSGIRQHYPRARLIVAAKFDLLNTERLRPVVGIEKYDLLRVGILPRAKVRSLVENWKLPATYQSDVVVDEIESRFQSLGIPLTAAYVSIYLSVLEQTTGYNPINSSTVIENFVEAALQKYKPQYIFRSSFDYRNQIDYLGFVAEKMCRLNSFLIPYEVLYQWTKEHFELIGVEHDYSRLIQHFVENRVFADEGNYLFFRYNIFLSFFVAHRMEQSPEFLQWLLIDFRYINFISEFDIYFGLSRRDSLTIELLGKQFANLTAQWDELIKPFGWADRLEKLSIPAAKKTDTDEFTASIERQLTGDSSAEARDKALVGEDELVSADVRPRRVRQAVTGTFPRWIMTLRVYTVALKNLENLPREKKEEHLRNILDGWSKVILYCCVGFKDIIEVRELEIGGTKIHLDLPEKVDARTIRSIFLNIPVVISELLRKDLGSPKLSVQLRSDSLAQSLSDSFLQTGLYADLKLPEYLGRLKAFRTRSEKQGSLIFQEVLLEKMRMLFLRLGLDENEQYPFLVIAAEISAELKGLSGEDRQREIDRYMNELRRKGQVNRLRDNMQ